MAEAVRDRVVADASATDADRQWRRDLLLLERTLRDRRSHPLRRRPAGTSRAPGATVAPGHRS